MSAAVTVTTTPSIEGKKITSDRGIVTGEAIMGANVFKDLFAGIRVPTPWWPSISTTKPWVATPAC